MKTLEERVSILETTLKNLQDSFIQAQKNNAPDVTRLDETQNGLKTTDGNVETNSANIDYLAMMTDVEIPTEE